VDPESIPAEPPAAFGDLFGIERSRLLALLATVEDAAWHLPTPCPEWDVLGLCRHLVGDDLAVLSWHRDGHRGTSPPDGVTPEGFIGWLDELQIEWVRAARRISPRLVTELLGWTGPMVADVLRAAAASPRTAHVSWASSDPVPAWLDHARELSEYWLHRQQLQSALGHDSDLRADVLAPVLDALRWAYPFRLDEAGLDVDGTVTVEVTGEVTTTWHLARIGLERRWGFVGAPASAPLAVVSMSTEQAWRLLSNNLAVQDQIGVIRSGNPALLRVLLRTRAIIGAPNGPDAPDAPS